MNKKAAGYVGLVMLVVLAAVSGWAVAACGVLPALRLSLTVAIPAAAVYGATRKRCPPWLTFVGSVAAWALAAYGTWVLLG